MTKKQLSEATGISRPTIDKRIAENDKVTIFLLSFELWEFEKRIKDYKTSYT